MVITWQEMGTILFFAALLANCSVLLAMFLTEAQLQKLVSSRQATMFQEHGVRP